MTDEQKAAITRLIESGEAVSGEMWILNSGRHRPGRARAAYDEWNSALVAMSKVFNMNEDGEWLPEKGCDHEWYVVGGQPGAFETQCRRCGETGVDG